MKKFILDREFILDHLKGFSVKKSEKPAKTLSTYGSVTHGTTKPTKIMMQLVLWICLYVTDLKCNQNTSSMFRKNMIPQVFINTNIYQYQILLIKYPKQFLQWDVDAGLEKNATWYQSTIKIKMSHKTNIPIICSPQPTNFSKQKVTLAV